MANDVGEAASNSKQGWFVAIGTGIKSVAHVSLEAKSLIENCDKVLYCVADPITTAWLKEVNPSAETLYTFYADGKNRVDTYREMTEYMCQHVRAGMSVCGVFYGHPGVFCWPTHEAVRVLRAEGYDARMLPAISAEDCLWADLGIDPSSHGCQILEATQLLVWNRTIDPASALVLWQIGCVLEGGFTLSGYANSYLDVLVDRLEETYGPDFEVALYEAAQLPLQSPRVEWMPLRELRTAKVTGISTLYAPPKVQPSIDHELLDRIGMRVLEHKASDSPLRVSSGARAEVSTMASAASK